MFLTPLTPRGVVVGKSLIHGLRSVTMLLATLPVLCLPFLLGGVTWREGVMALLLNLSSVCLALAAGLLASSRCRQWNRALVFAEVLAALFLLGFGFLMCFGFVLQVVTPFDSGFDWDEIPLAEFVAGAAFITTGVNGMWSEGLSSMPAAGALRAWLLFDAEVLVLSVLFLWLVTAVVARRVHRTWRDETPSARQIRLIQTFCAPRFWKSVFRSRMRRMLDRNPIGWLQQHSTAARMTKWSWCLFIIVAETILVAFADWHEFEEVQTWIALLLALSLAFSAAGSFRRERETRALELILVTPLRVGQMIVGRLRGLWGQFLPALVLFALAAVFLMDTRAIHYWRRGAWFGDGFAFWLLVLTLTTYATLPVIGLHFSLARKHFLTAWIMTALTGLVLPFLGALFLFMLVEVYSIGLALPGPGLAGFTSAGLLMAAAQAGFALLAFSHLSRNLSRRRFVST